MPLSSAGPKIFVRVVLGEAGVHEQPGKRDGEKNKGDMSVVAVDPGSTSDWSSRTIAVRLANTAASETKSTK